MKPRNTLSAHPRLGGEVVQKAWGTSDDDIAAAVAFANSHFAPEEE